MQLQFSPDLLQKYRYVCIYSAEYVNDLLATLQLSSLQELILVYISKFCSVVTQMAKSHEQLNIYQFFCIRTVVLIICFVANTRFYVIQNVQLQDLSRKHQTAPRLLSAKCPSKFWLPKKWVISYQFLLGLIKQKHFFILKEKLTKN